MAHRVLCRRARFWRTDRRYAPNRRQHAQGSEPGNWIIHFLYLKDAAGNGRSTYTAELEALGFPTSLLVISAADVTAPELRSLEYPASIDVTAGPSVLPITARVTDGAGLDFGYIEFISPSGQWLIVNLGAPQSGDPIDGSYQLSLTMPQFSEQGLWSIHYVFLKDRVGNQVSLWPSDLTARGMPSTLTVSSVSDLAAPEVSTFDYSPKEVDTSDAAAVVSLSGHLVDSPAGVQWGYVELTSPSGQWAIGDWRGAPASGTVQDGTWIGQATLPRYAEYGAWLVHYVFVKDNAGNSHSYYTADLAAMGFPTVLINGPTTITVAIDIKPGEGANSINTKSNAKIPVAVLSTLDFAAPQRIDRASLTFGRSGDEPSLASCATEDVNGDGALDLLCHFSTQAAGFQTGDTAGWLKGKTLDGKKIAGSDSVRILK